MANWDILKTSNHKQASDVTIKQVEKAIRSGQLDENDCIRKSGESNWQRLGELEPFASFIGKLKDRDKTQDLPTADSSKLKSSSKNQEQVQPSSQSDVANSPPPPPPVSPSAVISDQVQDSPDFADAVEDLPIEAIQSAPPPPPPETVDGGELEPKARKVSQTENQEPFAPIQPRFDKSPPIQLLKKRKRNEDLDLTAMVDVTFLLLLFFMLTAAYDLQATIETSVPPNEPGESVPSDTNIMIRIEADNTVVIDDTPISDPANNLTAEIKLIMEEEGKTEAVIINHEDAYHEYTVICADAATDAGATIKFRKMENDE